MRPVQIFDDEYLARCRAMTPDQIIKFLDDFRRLHGRTPAPSRLISIKVPQDLLDAFRQRAQLEGVAYQTKIKALMTEWLVS